MQGQSGSLTGSILNRVRESKHLIMGYVFLGLVFAGAVSSVYYWEQKRAQPADYASAKQVGSGENAGILAEPCPEAAAPEMPADCPR